MHRVHPTVPRCWGSCLWASSGEGKHPHNISMARPGETMHDVNYSTGTSYSRHSCLITTSRPHAVWLKCLKLELPANQFDIIGRSHYKAGIKSRTLGFEISPTVHSRPCFAFKMGKMAILRREKVHSICSELLLKEEGKMLSLWNEKYWKGGFIWN